MVSVIIPIYNIQDVLEKCVTSVLTQTYSNLEILLVDDGSKDNSSAICDQFAETDSRVRVLHKTNGGLSDARNYGLSHANGKYILYLDGDDWLAPNAIELMRNKAEETDADIIQCGYFYAYPEYLLTRKDVGPIKELAKEEALKELLNDGFIKNFAWGNLIKKELATTVSFIKGKYFEDIYWKYQIIDNSRTFIYVPQPLVYYRQRSNSISSAFSMKNMDLLIGSSQRLEFIKDQYPLLFSLALRKHWLLCFNFMKASENASQEIKKSFREYFENINYAYKESLNKVSKDSMYMGTQYFIFNHCEFLYPLYSIVERICNRFSSDIYTKIKC